MKYIFSLLLLCFALVGQSQIIKRGTPDTLLVRSLGPGGIISFVIAPTGDTLFLKNFPIITASALLDFPNTAGGTTSILTIPVPGAVDGDAVAVGSPLVSVLTGVIYIARVTAPGVVTVVMYNSATGSRNPAPGLFRVRVIQ
jgi:hypothetical protein